MSSSDTIALIDRARDGDRKAWDELIQRYYSRWIRKFSGELRTTAHSIEDAQDLVQSAIGDALKDIKDLRSEAAFFSWVSAIISRKIAKKARKRGRVKNVELEKIADPGKISNIGKAIAIEEENQKLLDAILELFPKYPEEICVLYLRHGEKLDYRCLMSILNKSKSSVFCLLVEGKRLLRERLTRDESTGDQRQLFFPDLEEAYVVDKKRRSWTRRLHVSTDTPKSSLVHNKQRRMCREGSPNVCISFSGALRL